MGPDRFDATKDHGWPEGVLRASGGSHGWQVAEVLLDSGERLSASSVAAVRGKRLLVGHIFEPRFFLDCELE